jgi:predicted  nucleic acid-binding Zn-ribbon protein
MQIRHRIPTIFNLSMVDVLCCALGCVILLWLLNLREAKERALAAGETGTRLQAVQSDLDEAISMLMNLARERDDVAKQAAATADERDRVRREWETARSRLAALEKDLTALKSQQTTTEDRLVKLTREKEMLAKEKADAAERLIQLDSLLSTREASAKTTARRVEELTEQLRAAESRSKKLQTEVQGYRGMFSATEVRLRTLEKDASGYKKDLDAANQSIDLLQKENKSLANQAGLLQQENKSLANQASRARMALENRFEGIMLTGRRVMFLVDMSGSMDYVEERTPDPEKWKGVRETLAKVMRSLNNLEKFQVILFANKISYLLGEDGRWLDYNPQTSVDRVVKALAAIKPRGSTNMYTAFESAFSFRAQGLDTIYVLSDGLPNDGPGLPDNKADLSETQRSDLLAKHIRKLLRGDWNRALAGRSRVRINTIGFFYESPDVGAFLWALARENDGSFVGMSKP